MKLILQIALGVFMGTLTSQLAVDGWRSYREGVAQEAEEKRRAEQEQVRREQDERIRALFLRSHQENTRGARKPPAGFVPDDAQQDLQSETFEAR